MSNQLKNFGSIIFFAFLVVILFKIYYDDYMIANHGRFCIGITKGWKRTAKGPTVYYEFLINGKIFGSSAKSGKDTLVLNGGRYFVRFLPNDPTVSRVMWDRPVPDCIGKQPLLGWAEIPICN
ncbi:MAG: hypothetical protein JNL53_20050 [Cyclobacteriaceae bacterium]|nr:hypothetical protein [Cyclobacteriaceae bacterium]